MNHISLNKKTGLEVMQSPTVLEVFLPHQLHWGDWEMGTAISYMECSQVAGLIQKSVEALRKHCLFVQLFFVQLPFVQRSCVAIVIIDRVIGADVSMKHV